MSYGRVQRQPGRRVATPYDRPRNGVHVQPVAESSSSSVPLLSRIINSVYGLFRSDTPQNDENPGRLTSIAESSEPRASSPVRQPAPTSSTPAYEWHGAPIEEMSYGELRRICFDEGLRVAEERDIMLDELRRHIDSQKAARRSDGQNNKRKPSSDNPSLEQIMMKKAKTGFSRDEFEKYMTLMKDNLKLAENDIGKFSPGRQPETPREIRRHSLPKRVPTPFAHISGQRPSRRDSFTGSGTMGPIHLSFPSTTTTTEDIHDLSNSSKTARSILSSISSMSTPLIQSNEILAKKRLQPRKPFNPYAQVGSAPAKAPFKIQPPAPKPSDEPVKASHKVGADGMLKKARNDSVTPESMAMLAAKRRAAESQQSAPDAFKFAPAKEPSTPAVAPAKEPVAPAKANQFQFPSATTPTPPQASPKQPTAFVFAPAPTKSVPAPAPVQESEEALCPECELSLDDVDHSDCKTDQSSPCLKPSAAPASGFSFGGPSGPSSAGGFSFQLPQFSESTPKDAAPSFSFAPPKPADSANFSFTPVSSDGASTTQLPKAPSPPTKFSFGQPSDQVETRSLDKASELKPAANSLFTSSFATAGTTFPSAGATKPVSFKSEAKPAELSAATSAAAPSFSFAPPATGGAGFQFDAAKSKTDEQPTLFGTSGKSSPFQFGASSQQPKSASPPSADAGFGFGFPSSSTSGFVTTIDLTKDSNVSPPASGPVSSGSNFEFKSQEPGDKGSAAKQSNTSATSFQFGNTSSQQTTSFQFGATDASAPAAPAVSAANASLSTPTSFQFGAAAPLLTPGPAAASQPNFGSGSLPSFPASVPPSSTSAPGFQFDTTASKPSAPTSVGFSFGASNLTTAAPAPNSTFQFGMSDSTSAASSSLAPTFSFGGSGAQPSQPSNSMQDFSVMTNNSMAASTPAPAFDFGSNMSTPSAGFGQSPTPSSSVFAQTPAPNAGFGFGASTSTKRSAPADGFQSGPGAFSAAPATPSSNSFTFPATTPSNTFVPSINFDAPVPNGLGGSFSHGMAPQGRPMVKAKRVARKR